MKKYITIAIFAVLIEIQVFLEGEYYLLVGAGMIMLSAYHLYVGRKDFKKKKIYFSKIFNIFKPDKEPQRANRLRYFSIPIIFIYFVNYFLSTQIQESLAYQFILILSCLVLFDHIHKGENFVKKLKKGEINEHEFEHYLFHRWSKYLSFFLGLWLIICLEGNGHITEYGKYALIFSFTVLYMGYLNRLMTSINVKDLVVITLTAGVISMIEPVTAALPGVHMPNFTTAIILYLFYDFADMHFHHKKFKDTSLKIWEQKAIIYILVIVFVSQLQAIENTPSLNIDTMFTSVIDSQDEITTKNIHVDDVENAMMVRTE